MIGTIRSSSAANAYASEYKKVSAKGEEGISVEVGTDDNPAAVVHISREALEALAEAQSSANAEEAEE